MISFTYQLVDILVNKIINLHLKILNKIKPAGSEKRLITLLLPYVNKKSRIIERNTNHIKTIPKLLTNEIENKRKSEDFKNFLKCIKSFTTKHKNKLSIQNQNKLQKLIASKYGKLAKCSVFNLSQRELSEEESFALSLGLNFSLPTKQLDKESVFLGFEKFYKQLSKLKPI